MSRIKKYLDKRASGIAKDKAIKDGVNPEDYVPVKTEKEYVVHKDLGIVEFEKEVHEIEESLDLTDDEFWTITNQFVKESKNNEKSAVDILQSIIEGYTPLKIKQFAKRYEELNT